MRLQLNDYIRNSELVFGDLDTNAEIECSATLADGNDVVWFYMNEEQARDLVRHLNREFDLGMHA